ncbi:MAG TPA: hypothetical protein VE081_13400 [Sporichthyaceae bacterium]|nr:hypothetical protein [Sporichthyaceae bacterium]
MKQWFVYPVQDGFELVVDSAEDDVLEVALAEIVAQYTDYNLLTEHLLDTAWVFHFVPAPVDAVPAPRSEAEQRSRAAHPAGKGRRIPNQDDRI